MNRSLRIGMIGLDTSHVIAFTELLHDTNHRYHVPGGKVVVAFPGGSPDFHLSHERVHGFTDTLRSRFGVLIVNNIEEAVEQSDAILLESVDGRVHLEQFKKIVPFGKPVFVDKPFSLNSNDAVEMARLAKVYGTLVMSSSALRYAEGITRALEQQVGGEIIGCDAFGPMAIEATQPGLFWYGIHSAEMLFTVLGKECSHVTATTNDDFDMIVGVWADGRIGTLRGNRRGNNQFGITIHREKNVQFVDVSANEKPYYASLLEKIIEMFTAGNLEVSLEETQHLIRFIEAANESRITGKTVILNRR